MKATCSTRMLWCTPSSRQKIGVSKVEPLLHCDWLAPLFPLVIIGLPARRIGYRWGATRAPRRGDDEGAGHEMVLCLSLFPAPFDSPKAIPQGFGDRVPKLDGFIRGIPPEAFCSPMPDGASCCCEARSSPSSHRRIRVHSCSHECRHYRI